MLVEWDQRHICLSLLWLLKSSRRNNWASPVHSTIVFLVITMFWGLVSYTAASLKFDLQTSHPIKTQTSKWQLHFMGTALFLCYCFNFNLRWILLHIFSTETKGKNLYALWGTIYCFDVMQCFNQQTSVCISPQLWFSDSGDATLLSSGFLMRSYLIRTQYLLTDWLLHSPLLLPASDNHSDMQEFCIQSLKASPPYTSLSHRPSWQCREDNNIPTLWIKPWIKSLCV